MKWLGDWVTKAMQSEFKLLSQENWPVLDVLSINLHFYFICIQFNIYLLESRKLTFLDSLRIWPLMFTSLIYSFIRSIFTVFHVSAIFPGAAGIKMNHTPCLLFIDLIITLALYPNQMTWPSSSSFLTLVFNIN